MLSYRIIYVVWKQVIRTYSTQTGDFVREFEATDSRIAGIAHHVDCSNTILGCTDSGDLVNWNCQNGLIIKKVVCYFSLVFYSYFLNLFTMAIKS